MRTCICLLFSFLLTVHAQAASIFADFLLPKTFEVGNSEYIEWISMTLRVIKNNLDSMPSKKESLKQFLDEHKDIDLNEAHDITSLMATDTLTLIGEDELADLLVERGAQKPQIDSIIFQNRICDNLHYTSEDEE